MNEKNLLYHGSISADITELKALSPLHGSNKKVVYLTDNIFRKRGNARNRFIPKNKKDK